VYSSTKTVRRACFVPLGASCMVMERNLLASVVVGQSSA
jgi:hypothetical protein